MVNGVLRTLVNFEGFNVSQVNLDPSLVNVTCMVDCTIPSDSHVCVPC